MPHILKTRFSCCQNNVVIICQTSATNYQKILCSACQNNVVKLNQRNLETKSHGILCRARRRKFPTANRASRMMKLNKRRANLRRIRDATKMKKVLKRNLVLEDMRQELMISIIYCTIPRKKCILNA